MQTLPSYTNLIYKGFRQLLFLYLSSDGSLTKGHSRPSTHWAHGRAVISSRTNEKLVRYSDLILAGFVRNPEVHTVQIHTRSQSTDGPIKWRLTVLP